mmetsp:Transcript_129635/g.336270  ORF Transcript_129635/g.336270 Transcript_129635/m.336270 type:complete len:224 (+) Transcript_129635:86-757(+)
MWGLQNRLACTCHKLTFILLKKKACSGKCNWVLPTCCQQHLWILSQLTSDITQRVALLLHSRHDYLPVHPVLLRAIAQDVSILLNGCENYLAILSNQRVHVRQRIAVLPHCSHGHLEVGPQCLWRIPQSCSIVADCGQDDLAVAPKTLRDVLQRARGSCHGGENEGTVLHRFRRFQLDRVFCAVTRCAWVEQERLQIGCEVLAIRLQEVIGLPPFLHLSINPP